MHHCAQITWSMNYVKTDYYSFHNPKGPRVDYSFGLRTEARLHIAASASAPDWLCLMVTISHLIHTLACVKELNAFWCDLPLNLTRSTAKGMTIKCSPIGGGCIEHPSVCSSGIWHILHCPSLVHPASLRVNQMLYITLGQIELLKCLS